MASTLIGDIGGTNARFALVEAGSVTTAETLPVAGYPSLLDAIRAYLRDVDPKCLSLPTTGILAVAGPVTGDLVSLTNHPWSFSIQALAAELGFSSLRIVNDFVAQAAAIPRLGSADRRQIGDGAPCRDAPIGVIGPGSGLGVSILVPFKQAADTRWSPIASEGGHVTLAAVTEREAAIIDWLHRSGRDHVSAETLICGHGLTVLHEALAALDGVTHTHLTPSDVTASAMDGTDSLAEEAVHIFLALLGTVAGNLALTAGTRGGVYIAGGIVPKLGNWIDKSLFRERFVAKGRMRPYLEPIPTYVITVDIPAFQGLLGLLEQD